MGRKKAVVEKVPTIIFVRNVFRINETTGGGRTNERSFEESKLEPS